MRLCVFCVEEKGRSQHARPLLAASPLTPPTRTHPPAPLQAGYILPCSAKPLTDLVVEYSDDWGVSVLEEWKHTART